ncbi:MAG: SPOR domain-containing protein [Pseudoxanthomonas sp.]|nr:SPOR domain-containing protein [Pseudoxanthomonas sp.]
MARRSNHARRGASTALPAWLWLVAGIVIGIVLALLAVRSGLAPGLRPAQEQPQPQAARPAGTAEEAPARATTYDFYTVLPEMEVLIPDAELKAQVRAETPAAGTAAAGTTPADATATSAPAATRYRLQAGSFRDPRPAEEAKARLALLGISASVQSVNVNGNTFHRVYVGPYASAAEVDRVKRQLADNGVQAITVREQAP